MKKAQRIQKAKMARATQEINRQANKEIALLREQLKTAITDNKRLEQELQTVKKQLVSTAKELKRAKVSHVQFKQATKTVIKSYHVKLTNLQYQLRKEIKQAATSGPFSSFGYTKGYKAAAISAGNRLERQHPGFYNLVSNLPDILTVIWDFYSTYHTDEGFYDIHGEDYTDAEDYELLKAAIKEKYGVEVNV